MARLDYGFTIMRKQALFGRVEERAFFDRPDTFTALTHACEGVRGLMGEAGFEPTPDGPLPDGWVRGGRASFLRMQRRLRDALPDHPIDEHPEDAFQFETFLARLASDTPLRGEVGIHEGQGFSTGRGVWTAAFFGILVLLFAGLYVAAEHREQVAGAPIDAAATIARESGVAGAVDATGLLHYLRSTAADMLAGPGAATAEAPPERPEADRMRGALDALNARR